MNRYARQSIFRHIGEAGQQKILGAKVAIIGMGALGTVSANNLCRAGVGYIRMVDRDYVELTNLQRQILYNEDDATQRIPKAVAAAGHLSRVNSEITLEPVVADVNASNIENLIGDVDLVLDATDNWEIRLLINEACHKNSIPWIYCGALGAQGMTMNIMPGGPCLRCFVPGSPGGSSESCSTTGVLNMITNAIASVQTAEAIKILIGSEYISKKLLTMDLWTNYIKHIAVEQDVNCPVCGQGKYEFLGKTTGSYTTNICGSNSVQVVPANPTKPDFSVLAGRLRKIGEVKFNQFTLVFSGDKYEITLFADGRAMIKNAVDEASAKSIYTEYIGI